MHSECAQNAGNGFSESKILSSYPYIQLIISPKLKSPESDKLHFEMTLQSSGDFRTSVGGGRGTSGLELG